MLIGEAALKYLANRADDPEKDRSIHWENEYKNFAVDAGGLVSGATVLGNLSQKSGAVHRLVHWILQYPFRMMGRKYNTFGEDLRNGYLVAERQDGRQFTLDVLAQVLALSFMRHHLPPIERDNFNIVVGDGYAMMTALLFLIPSPRRTIIVNLTKSLLLDMVYFQKVFPDKLFALVCDESEMKSALADDDISLIAVQADNAGLIAEAPIGLAINIVSMQEMVPDVIASYFDLFRNNKADTTYFYCCNRLSKRLADGTTPSFRDYPWRESDGILADGPCFWRNWSYSKTLPFWRRRARPASGVWHRLSNLGKSGT